MWRGCLPANSRRHQQTMCRKVPQMFPLPDPSLQLDLHRQRVAELIQQAADHERARSLGRRRFARWRRPARREAVVRATATI
jgi:hypothetical protein